MASWVQQAEDRARHYRNLAFDTYWSVRRRRPVVDHAVRAYERYADRNGTQLAGAVTYFAFLSFFPILALAFAAVGYAATFQLELRDYVEQVLEEILPGLSEQLPVDQIADARVGAGVIGLLGLLYAGLNSVWALRQALHSIWLRSVREGPNFLVAKAGDLLVLAVLGLTLLVSVVLTSLAQAATRWLLAWVDLDGSLVAVAAIRGLGLVIAVGVNMLLFLIVFTRLSGSGQPLRLMWRGALLGAVGFEILKSTAALLLAGTLTNPVYASFAVVVGLLVWINLVMRLVVFSAAWTATWLPVPPPYTGSMPLSAEDHGTGDRDTGGGASGPGSPGPGGAPAGAHPVPSRPAPLRPARRPPGWLVPAGAAAGAAGAAGAVYWWLRRGRRR